jgi:DNA-binding NtrC family response regulator
MPATVLIVDDERSVRDGLARAVGGAGYATKAVEGIVAARAALAAETIDCVLLDVRLKDGDGLQFLEELRKSHPRLPVIMATAYGDSDRTIAAMKHGAFDYVTKPFDLDLLMATIQRAIKGASATPAPPPPIEPGDSPLVGSSAKMLEVWKAIGRAASSDVPVLVTGESGTGKELVARAIHQNGDRRDGPFVAVNVAALPATLVESELFGHEKGAFTGAAQRREGRFETASRGTLFLDEIGDLDVATQTKLLRVLQDGTFERVGSQAPLVSRARVIAATSKPVDPPKSALREDLFYRLSVVRIEVPPLRDRRSDIPLLVEAFLRRAKPSSGAPARRAISEAAMRKLVAHSWPGNVRELLHVLGRACVMTTAEVIDEGDLSLPEPASGSSATAIAEDDLDLHRNVEALERSLIERALRRAGGNRAEASRLLGIARPQLYAKMKDLGIEPPDPKRS